MASRGKEPEGETAETQPYPGGRTHYITIPIRPLSGNVPDEYLDRLALYYTLYALVFAALGVIAIVFPLVFGIAVHSLLAWLLVLGGAITLLQFVLICCAPGTTAFLLLGALHLAAGIWLMLKPNAVQTSMTNVLAIWFLAHGVLKLLMSIQVRNLTTWPGLLATGFLSIILAFLIIALTPTYGPAVIGVSVGGDLILTGFALLLISFMAFLGKGKRAVTDAEISREPLLHDGNQHAAASTA